MVMNIGPLGQNPLGQNPFDLDPQSQRIQQLMMGKQQQQPQQQFTTPTPAQGQITGLQQQAITDAENAKIRGMSTILGAKATGPWTALAQTLAAGYVGQKGRKRNEKQAGILTKALQNDADKIELERVEKLRQRNQDVGMKQEALDIQRAKSERRTFTGARSQWKLKDGTTVTVVSDSATGKPVDSQGEYVDLRGAEMVEKTPAKKTFSGARTQWKLKDGGTVTVVNDPETGKPVNSQGEHVDLRGAEQVVRQRASSAGMAESGLTQYQHARKLESLGKRLSPVVKLTQQLSQIREALNPFREGGKRAGEDIPGVGRFEGMANVTGQVIRGTQDFFSDQPEAEDFYARTSGVINTIIKDRAGLAQSANETFRTLSEMGETGWEEEGTYLSALNRIEAAIQKDLNLIYSTSNDGVRNDYVRNMAEIDEPNIFSYQPLQQTFEQTGDIVQPNTQASQVRGQAVQQPDDVIDLGATRGDVNERMTELFNMGLNDAEVVQILEQEGFTL